MKSPRAIIGLLIKIPALFLAGAYHFWRLKGARSAHDRGLANKIIQSWCRTFCKILGMHVQTTGTPPSAPFFLVGNHLSYLDIVGLLSVTHASFVAKSEVRDWPLIGGIATAFGTLYIKRDSLRDAVRTRDRILDHIASGESIIVFPEGTSTSGESVLPFRGALLEAARLANLKLNWHSLYYTSPKSRRSAADALCWWGGMGFMSHLLGVLQEPPFDLHIHFGPDSLSGTDRKELAQRLQQKVSTGLTELKTELKCPA